MKLLPLILISLQSYLSAGLQIWVFQSGKSELIWNLWNCNFYDFLTRKIHELQFRSLGSILHWLVHAVVRYRKNLANLCKNIWIANGLPIERSHSLIDEAGNLPRGDYFLRLLCRLATCQKGYWCLYGRLPFCHWLHCQKGNHENIYYFARFYQ